MVGVTRDECFVTNVVKCRPPGNRTPRREEMDACRAWLDAQVGEVAPRVTLAVGLTAAREVLGDARTMARLHGRVVARPGGVAVATYHPAAALRTPSVVDGCEPTWRWCAACSRTPRDLATPRERRRRHAGRR